MILSTGLGFYNTNAANASFTNLKGFVGSMIEMDITASKDGRISFQGYVGTNNAHTVQSYTYIQPEVIAVKSPSLSLDLIKWG